MATLPLASRTRARAAGPVLTVLWPLVAAALSFVAWQPFVRPDFNVWKADDGEYHLLRVYVFGAAVRAGEWLPRWTPDLNLGYGYPIFNYYAPGTYYVALMLRALGLDVYTTVQALGALACCLGAAGAYCLARGVFASRLSGLVAALCFLYAPYPFITNLVIRADLAETLGLGLLPWALLAAWHAGQRGRRRDTAMLAAALGALVLTHNLTALVALPAALAVAAFAAWRSGTVGHGLSVAGAGVGLGLALTAFFWVPALAEQSAVQIEIAVQTGHKSPRSWLIDPLGATEQTRQARNPQTHSGPLDLHWSYPYDLNYPPKPSLAQGALFAVAVLGTSWAALRRSRRAAEAAFFLAGTVVLWLATTTWSGWAWDHVPLMRFLQFSWRLYGPLALALGMAAAGAVGAIGEGEGNARRTTHAGLRTTSTWVAGMVVLGLTVGLAWNTTTARPLWIDPHVERRVSGPQIVGTENGLFGAGTTTGGEFVPRSVDTGTTGSGQRRGSAIYEQDYPEFAWVAGRAWLLDDTKARVVSLAGGPTWTNAVVEADAPVTVGFRTVAFPGWRAYLDGQPVTPALAPRDPVSGFSPGFLTVDVPAGRHAAQIAFGPTRLRSMTALISVVTLGAAGWWLSAGARRHRRASWVRAAALAPPVLLGAACLHDALRPALGAPARPAASQERLVADVVQLAKQGQAQVSSPSGPALGPFVNVQSLLINGRARRFLYMHPPSNVAIPVWLPPRAAFQAGLALDPRAWDAEGADGVTFEVEVTPDGGEPLRVLLEHVNPRARGEDRGWLDRWVDLSAFGGRHVTLMLRTEPGATIDYDWAGWADPLVFVQKDARRPGGEPPRPLPTPRAS